MNCQCNAGFIGDWSKDKTGRNVPIWRCKSCDAYSGVMTSQKAAEFRKEYFAITPPMKRATWLRHGAFFTNWEVDSKEEELSWKSVKIDGEIKAVVKTAATPVQLKLFGN